MVAHLLPISSCMVTMIRSSSSVQSPFTIRGSKWWHHRSRHCFDVRPGMRAARVPQFLCPWLTRDVSTSSSSLDHCPFTRPGLHHTRLSHNDQARSVTKMTFFLQDACVGVIIRCGTLARGHVSQAAVCRDAPAASVSVHTAHWYYRYIITGEHAHHFRIVFFS